MKAFGVGVACPAHWTLADCPVTLWRAEGTRGARVVWELAGVLTLAIQAGLRVRALRVRLAASLDWVAATVGISSEATGTQASWLVIVDSAGGLRSTWIPVGARVDTVSLDTCLSGSTLIITLAANLHRSTYRIKSLGVMSSSLLFGSILRMGSQLTSPLPEKPGLQVHTMTLAGSVS